MVKTYFLHAWRILKKQKDYFVINILGLTLALTCALVICLIVRYHLTFDNFHPHPERLYRVITTLHREQTSHSTGVPDPLGATFNSDYALTDKSARIFTASQQQISIGDNKFEEEIAYADPGFFELMHFPVVQGDQRAPLTISHTAFISARLARKYFGDRQATGQTIRIGNKADFVIAGILKDIPANTDRRSEIYLPLDNLKETMPWVFSNEWGNVNSNFQYFISLSTGVTTEKVNQALADMRNRHYNKEDSAQWEFTLQPLSDIHFNTDLNGAISHKSLATLSLIGLLVLLTGCVNFINLATAQATRRAREIGVRKVLGSQRHQLFWQFMAETALLTVTALAAAIALTGLLLPYVNRLLDVQLPFSLLNDRWLLMALPLLLLVTTALAGAYPGIVLSGFRPIQALRGLMPATATSNTTTRKGLVIGQLALTQLLIISAVVMARQIHYALKSNPGFRKDAIVILPIPDNNPSKLNALKAQLTQLPAVENLTFCYAPPASDRANGTDIQYNNRPKPEGFVVSYRVNDENYLSVFNLQLVAGRNIYASDTVREFLLNETAVRKMGIASPEEVIGKPAIINGDRGTIVGVVKDFHNKSFHTAIDALCITSAHVWYSRCAINIRPDQLTTSLNAIERAWKTTYPEHFFKSEFLDQQIEHFYRQDYTLLRLIWICCGIAIFIGCLGLYGLIAFMTSRKTKEIGIRKILGANVSGIIWLFGRELSWLILGAFVIAAAPAWWIMNTWLHNFAFHITIDAGIFLLTLIITTLLVMLAVGYQTVKTATINPVKALRE